MWYQALVETPRGNQNEVLSVLRDRVLVPASRRGLRWYFTRVVDGGSESGGHLDWPDHRLQFMTSAWRLSTALRNEYVMSWEGSKIVRFSEAVHDLPRHILGGPEALSVCVAVLWADSHWTLCSLEDSWNELSSSGRWVSFVLRTLFPRSEERLTYLDSHIRFLTDMWFPADTLTANDRRHMDLLAERGRRQMQLALADYNLRWEWNRPEHPRHSLQQLRVLAKESKLALSFDHLVHILIHGHCNRMGLSPTHELVLMWMLRRAANISL